MALIPVEEAPERKGILSESEPSVGFRWFDVVSSLILGILSILLIFPPQETVDILGYPVGVRLIILLLIVIMVIQRSIVKFDEYERGVIFRLGRFNKVVGPGWAIVFPIMEKAIRIDLRLHVYGLDPQEVVTRDKVRFLVSPEVFMYVSNPKDAVINVRDYKNAVLKYVTSALTHTCGNSDSDYIISHMDDIVHRLEDAVHHISNLPGKEWGVVIPKVKLTMVRFPDKVQDAMHDKVASEQLKLAAHEKAEATKIEIDAIREAGSKLTDPAITYMYLEALDKVARGRATKIILPLEVSKIAESVTRRTGTPVGEIPQIQIPPGMIEQYKNAIDDYEKRIKSIENRLGSGTNNHRGLPERIKDYENEIVEKPKMKIPTEDKEKYKKRIKEIRERLGVKSR
jgi:regulator of protease activity HflC (stomatin/prohibitin superfamily)